VNIVFAGAGSGRVVGGRQRGLEEGFDEAQRKNVGGAAVLARSSPTRDWARLGDGSPPTAAQDRWPHDAPVH